MIELLCSRSFDFRFCLARDRATGPRDSWQPQRFHVSAIAARHSGLLGILSLDVELGEQSRSSSGNVLGSIGYFLWRAWNGYRFFTPHYWRMRTHRDAVAHTMQGLLPPPYDPYAIELRCRSINHAAVPANVSQQNDAWSR